MALVDKNPYKIKLYLSSQPEAFFVDASLSLTEQKRSNSSMSDGKGRKHGEYQIPEPIDGDQMMSKTNNSNNNDINSTKDPSDKTLIFIDNKNKNCCDDSNNNYNNNNNSISDSQNKTINNNSNNLLNNMNNSNCDQSLDIFISSQKDSYKEARDPYLIKNFNSDQYEIEIDLSENEEEDELRRGNLAPDLLELSDYHMAVFFKKFM
jgi:hypothetical protein